MPDYPLAPLGASCSRTAAMRCVTHLDEFVEVAPNVWECPMGVLEDLAQAFQHVGNRYLGDGFAEGDERYERAVRVLNRPSTRPSTR